MHTQRSTWLEDTLRDRIRNCGLTPHALAMRAQVAPPNLAKFLAGGRLRSDSLCRIFDMLGLTVVQRQ
jgi:hypothetical protein